MLFLIIALGAGLILAAQNAINAELSACLKSPIAASFLGYVVGTLFLFLLTIIIGDFSKIADLFSAPLWLLTGGLFGLIFVTSCIILFPKIGAVETVMLPTLGQIVASLLFETVGWFNVDIIPMTLLRIVGLMVLLLGTYIAVVLATQRKTLASRTQNNQTSSRLVLRLWAFGAGVLCTVQSTFNGQLGNLIDSPTVSALWAFVIGLIVLVFLKPNTWQVLVRGIKMPQSWSAGVAGGTFVTLMSLLIPKLGPGLTVSISTLGVMVGAMLVQQFGLFKSSRQNVSMTQVIGILIMLSGIILIKMF